MNNYFRKNLRYGFSLLELLIYVTILSFIVIALSNMFISLSKGRGQAQARGEVHDSLRFSAQRIAQDIKGASVLTTPSAVNLPSSSLVLTVSGVTVTYDISAGVLRRSAPSAIAVTGSNVVVDTLTFTRIENTNTILNQKTIDVQVNIAMHYNSLSNDWKYSDSLQTTVAIP